MKKSLLLLASLLILSPISVTKAVEIADDENQQLVQMNEAMYKDFFFSFNPDNKTYSIIVNLSDSIDIYSVKDGSADSSIIEKIENLKIKLKDIHSTVISEVGSGYTHKVLSGANSDEVFFEFKDGETIVDVTSEEIAESENETNVSIESPSPEPVEVSRESNNALKSAEQYLRFMSFSKQGLYDQLLYEKYPEDAAQYAVDNVVTDWNENALNSANQYLDFMAFSTSGLYDQLIYEGYTDEQAQYAIDNLD